MPTVRGTVDDVVNVAVRLHTRLRRGLVLVGQADRGQAAKIAVALKRALSPEEVEWVHVLRLVPRTRILRDLNRRRDLLHATRQHVLLTAPDEPGLRLIRGETLDLTAAPDLVFEVAEAVPFAPAHVVSQLRQRAREETAIVDLGGLLPVDGGHGRIRVEELYVELLPEFAAPPTEAARGGRRARWLMVGQPGAGKTTGLRMLAYEYSADRPRDRLGVGDRVPVYIPLTAYAQAREEWRATLSLREFAGRWLADQGIEGVDHLWAAGPGLLLLLDGLDEVRGAEVRRHIVDEVRRAGAEDDVVIVLAGRTLVLDEMSAEQVRDFTVVAMKAPVPADVRRVLGRIFTARGRVRPDSEASDAAAQIARDRDVADLARTPLLLVFLAILYETEGRIPDRRFLLYARIADILLDRWERSRARARGAGAGPRTFALGDTRRVVGTLAWWMIENGRDDCSPTELREELARIERGRGATEEEARARADGLADALGTSSALLVAAAGRWRFVHATLAEFFAGIEVARGGKRWDSVLADVFRPDWQEIVPFAAGELGVRADDERLGALTRVLCARPRTGGRYSATRASLIGAVLRQDPGFRAREAETLVQWFVDLCFRPAYWPRSQLPVALALREAAGVAAERTWGKLFQRSVLAWVDGLVLRDDHTALATVLPEVVDALGGDAVAVANKLTLGRWMGVSLSGFRWLHRRANHNEQEEIEAQARDAVSAGMRAHVGFILRTDTATFLNIFGLRDRAGE